MQNAPRFGCTFVNKQFCGYALPLSLSSGRWWWWRKKPGWRGATRGTRTRWPAHCCSFSRPQSSLLEPAMNPFLLHSSETAGPLTYQLKLDRRLGGEGKGKGKALGSNIFKGTKQELPTVDYYPDLARHTHCGLAHNDTKPNNFRLCP